MKRWIYGSLAAATLAALGTVWFLDKFERVETQVWVGPSAAARANPYLAAMRFAERLGLRARVEEQPARLQSLPARTAVVLPAARAWLSAARAQTLLRDAEQGAHLIVEPEPARSRDPLLDALGIARRTVKPATGTLRLAWPDDARGMQVEAGGTQALDLARVQADIALADAQGVRFASLRHGAGRISVLTGLHRLDNGHIGRHDHAELLRRLLALERSESLLVVRAAAAPPLWEWLTEHARGVMIAAAALIALALWRVLPRFGRLLPEPHPARRELLEHLRAAGRFRWQHGTRARLLAPARELVERHIAQAAPRLAHLPRERRYAELASQLGADAGAIAHACQATPRTAREMVQMTATLASIHAGLRGLRPRATRARKRR